MDKGPGEVADLDDLTPALSLKGEGALMKALNRHLPPEGQVLAAEILPLNVPGIDKSIQRLHYSARWTLAPDQPRISTEVMAALLAEFRHAGTLTLKRMEGKGPQAKMGYKTLETAPFAMALNPDGSLSFDIVVERCAKKQMLYPAKPSEILGAIETGLPNPVIWQLARQSILLG